MWQVSFHSLLSVGIRREEEGGLYKLEYKSV